MTDKSNTASSGEEVYRLTGPDGVEVFSHSQTLAEWYATKARHKCDVFRLVTKAEAPAEVSSEWSMSAQELADDDALRFIQRVLESNAPEADRKAARDMALEMRMRFRQQSTATVEGELTDEFYLVRRQDCSEFVHPAYGSGVFFTEDCNVSHELPLNQRLAVKEGIIGFIDPTTLERVSEGSAVPVTLSGKMINRFTLPSTPTPDQVRKGLQMTPTKLKSE